MTERARVSAYPRICVINSLWEVYFLAVWLERSFRQILTNIYRVFCKSLSRILSLLSPLMTRGMISGHANPTVRRFMRMKRERETRRIKVSHFLSPSKRDFSISFLIGHTRDGSARRLNCICQIVQKPSSSWKNGKRPSVSKYRIACVFSSRSDFLAVYSLPTHNRIHSCRCCGNLSENSSGS